MVEKLRMVTQEWTDKKGSTQTTYAHTILMTQLGTEGGEGLNNGREWKATHNTRGFKNLKKWNNRITKAGLWQKEAVVAGIVAVEGNMVEVVLHLCS